MPDGSTSRAAVRHVASVLLVALVSACSLQPTYERPPAPVASTFPSGPAYKPPVQAGNQPELAAGDIGWRDFFVDPRLQRLVAIALDNNRDLRVAALNVSQAQAQYRVERATLFPRVDANASAARTRTPASLSSNGSATISRDNAINVSVAWEIDFFGRLRSLSDAALQQYFASDHARRAAQILLVSQVADQYLAMLALDDELAVTRNTVETAKASFDIVRLQRNTGTASELDERLAQTILEQARANYAAQVRLRAQAENNLVLLIGQPLPADLPPPLSLTQQNIVADIPAQLPSDLLVRRPDILQAEAALQAENANIGAARAAFFPQITLTGVLGTASAALGGLFAGGSGAWSLVPALAAPIFDAGANQANLDIANIQKDIGIAQYQKAIQVAFREVSDGLAARGTYDDQVDALRRNAEAEQRRLDLATMRYKNGVDSYLGVLTAQTDLYDSQLALVSAQMNRLTNLVDLYRALGGGWRERDSDESPPASTQVSSLER